MITVVIGQADGLIVGLERRLERVPRLGAVLVHFNGPIVDLGYGDDLNVIAEAPVLPFTLQISIEIFGYVLLEIVCVFCLLKIKSKF